MFHFNYAKAKILAEKWLELSSETEVVIIEEATIAKPYGWVFFYQSKSYIETDDFRQMMAGNCPILIDRFDGSLITFGTSYPIEKYLEDYEKTIPPARMQIKAEFPPDDL